MRAAVPDDDPTCREAFLSNNDDEASFSMRPRFAEVVALAALAGVLALAALAILLVEFARRAPALRKLAGKEPLPPEVADATASQPPESREPLSLPGSESRRISNLSNSGALSSPGGVRTGTGMPMGAAGGPYAAVVAPERRRHLHGGAVSRTRVPAEAQDDAQSLSEPYQPQRARSI